MELSAILYDSKQIHAFYQMYETNVKYVLKHDFLLLGNSENIHYSNEFRNLEALRSGCISVYKRILLNFTEFIFSNDISHSNCWMFILKTYFRMIYIFVVFQVERNNFLRYSQAVSVSFIKYSTVCFGFIYFILDFHVCIHYIEQEQICGCFQQEQNTFNSKLILLSVMYPLIDSQISSLMWLQKYGFT